MADVLEFNRRCRFCKTEGLRWSDEDPKRHWKLVDKAGNIHNCDSPLKHNYYKEKHKHESMKAFMEASAYYRHIDEVMKNARLYKKRRMEGEEDPFLDVAEEEHNEELIFSAGSKVN